MEDLARVLVFKKNTEGKFVFTYNTGIMSPERAVYIWAQTANENIIVEIITATTKEELERISLEYLNSNQQ